MANLRNHDDVLAYLRSIPEGASTARRWQAVRTATRRLLTAYGVPNATKWTVEKLPPQATASMGDCYGELRRIRYLKQCVEGFWINDLASLIVHEVAHAVVYHEMGELGLRSKTYGAGAHGGHGKMWRGVMATMGVPNANSQT